MTLQNKLNKTGKALGTRIENRKHASCAVAGLQVDLLKTLDRMIALLCRIVDLELLVQVGTVAFSATVGTRNITVPS